MKSGFLVVWLMLSLIQIRGQSIPIVPRSVNALSGDAVVNLITNMTRDAREEELYNQIVNGNIPDFIRQLKTVTATVNIGGTNSVVKYYVTADYLAVGSDSNYFLTPMTPLLGQRIANALHCVLPTKKMVDQIYTSALCKLKPQPIPPTPQMITVPVFKQHNDSVWSLRQPLLQQFPLGTLVGGTKKDVIISNRIYNNLNPNVPKPVVIYGWHQLNGTPIQPVYNGHEETYADYSHGIRLVLDSFFVDGVYKSYASLLADAQLSALVSDEGVIPRPGYNLAGLIPPTPSVFCVASVSVNTLKIKAQHSAAMLYKAFYGTTLQTMSDSSESFTDSVIITGLIPGENYYIKLRTADQGSLSLFSEVLAAVPSAQKNSLIIINGFDRPVTGNTFDFVKMHGPSFLQAGLTFDAATNEAITLGLINLSDYQIADYILGTESTANETFSTEEQELIKSFLKNGGSLFASGSEIAWDLDYRGSASDKDFIKLYLKTQYVNDAPAGLANTYYTASGLPGEVFSGVNGITFDNGSHGTFNVGYPDVLQGNGGSTHIMQYSGVTAQIAAVGYSGIFPGGTKPGKAIIMGFPFEAVYPESKRNEIANVLKFFFASPMDAEESGSLQPELFSISNYPNPFNSSTNIMVNLPVNGEYRVAVYTVQGEMISLIHTGYLPAGLHKYAWDASDRDKLPLASGVYIVQLTGSAVTSSLKLLLLR